MLFLQLRLYLQYQSRMPSLMLVKRQCSAAMRLECRASVTNGL